MVLKVNKKYFSPWRTCFVSFSFMNLVDVMVYKSLITTRYCLSPFLLKIKKSTFDSLRNMITDLYEFDEYALSFHVIGKTFV